MFKPNQLFNPATTAERTHYFSNGGVNNRVVAFPGPTNAPLLVFVANWRAKLKHWRAFIEVLQQNHRILYFETREKEVTQYLTDKPDLSVNAMVSDLHNFLNRIERPYHLLGVSVGTSLIMRAWQQLRQKPKSLVLLCPVLKVRMPAYFRVFPFINITTFTRFAPLVYRLMSISPSLKSVRSTLHRAMTEQNFTALAVMKESVQHLLRMPDPLAAGNCRPKGRTLVVRSLRDPIHTAGDANRVMDRLGIKHSFTCNDFRSVHAAATAKRLLPFLGVAG